MKSYQEHLQTLLNSKPTSVTHEASAIFPFFAGGSIQTRLIFLNYWKLKRNIGDVQLTVLLRGPSGELLHEKKYPIDELKAYEIDLSQTFVAPCPFFGSIEVKFTSAENLVFPFPGATILYSGKNWTSFVHSAQRIYRNQTDQKTTTRKAFLESGFNVYATEDCSPFISLVNGIHPLVNESIQCTAINDQGQKIEMTFSITAQPYQTWLTFFQDWKKLQEHFNNRPGTLKLNICNTGTFPRLIVGNYNHKLQTMSVTHTYYDLSSESKDSDYWSLNDSHWHPMSLTLPLIENDALFTKVYFYPIYSPCSFWVDAELRNAQGDVLQTLPRMEEITPGGKIQHLDFTKHISPLTRKKDLSVRLTAYPSSDQPIAARIKVGYDVGHKNNTLPSNVCTNFAPANPNLLNKPSAFRWAPLISSKHGGEIWCLNGSGLKDYTKEACVRITYYRTKDSKTLTDEVRIPPQGHYIVKHTAETTAFLENSTGWCTFESDNPFISTYYFAFNEGQVVGADHGF